MQHVSGRESFRESDGESTPPAAATPPRSPERNATPPVTFDTNQGLDMSACSSALGDDEGDEERQAAAAAACAALGTSNAATLRNANAANLRSANTTNRPPARGSLAAMGEPERVLASDFV